MRISSCAQLANLIINCLKLIIKKVTLICWMCSKLKINTAWHSWLRPRSAYQYSVSIFNFEQVFGSKVWETGHNVLKTQKAICFFLNKKSHFIQRFTIEHIMNVCFSSNFALGISISVLSSLFPRNLILLAVWNRKPTLKQWNKLVSI